MKIIILFICLCLASSIGGCKNKDESNYNQLSIANPYDSVESSNDFSDNLGITLDAPFGATNVSYFILNKKIAQVDFVLNDIHFTFRASKTVKDMLHGVYEPVKKYEQFFIENNIEVNINTTDDGTQTVTWSNNNINYSLTIDGLLDTDTILSFVQASIQ